MAFPALRQPKCMKTKVKDIAPKKYLLQNTSANISNTEYVIVTMKDDKKLVITSDAFHGIFSSGDVLTCVFCDAEVEDNFKEAHKNTIKHKERVSDYPHIEKYSEHLMRQICKDTNYCTMCNAVVSTPYLNRHINSDEHKCEFEKAVTRASTYKPYLHSLPQ